MPSLPGKEEPAADVSAVQAEVPTLAPAGAYQLGADSVVAIEISEYAGYAGLIAANGGLEPTPGSLFTKYCGFRVRLTISEEESWSALNERQARRLRHHHRCPRRVWPPVQGEGAGPDRFLARRRRTDRREATFAG